MRVLLSAMLLTAAASGCYATTRPTYYGSGVTVTATTVAPDLVYISPGVQVVADYDEPIFYSDGYYWRETGGVWYRSSYHTHGWAYAAPPRTVISIENRHSYRRYRPANHRNHTDHHGHTTVRDNRDLRRDQRDERREHRQDRREERHDRRDHRQDRREERRDHREDRRDRRDHRR